MNKKSLLMTLVILTFFKPMQVQANAKLFAVAAEMAIKVFTENKDFLIKRVRRMNHLGFSTGLISAFDRKSGYVDNHLTIGMDYYLFSDPLFSLSGLKEMVIDIAKEKLKAKLKEKFKNKNYKMTKQERKQLFQELEKEIIVAFDRLLNGKPSSWPKPTFGIYGDWGHSIREERGSQLRIGMGIGMGKFLFGPTAAVEYGKDANILLGPELSTNFLIGAGPRALLINVFSRYEWRFTSDNRDNAISIGAKISLDLI